MNQSLVGVLAFFTVFAWLSTHAIGAAEIVLADNFKGKLGGGWSWVREHPGAWRATGRGLEVRVEPGNMWGAKNNARNVLVRPAPEIQDTGLEVCVTVTNNPTSQYEQVDLVWYYDDSNMVKLGQELVNGKLSVVMGREEGDKTRTIRIVPLVSTEVQLRFLVNNNAIRGQFRALGAKEWTEVGQCDLPAPVDRKPHISLQFYQGPADVEHWARVREFRIARQ